MAAFSVNPPFRSIMTTLATVLPLTSTTNCCAPDVDCDLVYDGSSVSLDSAPQRVPVSLIRLDGSIALTGHYIVDMISTHDCQYPSEHFVGSSRQIIPLSGYRDLEPGVILGTASALLLHVPLEALVPHGAHIDVAPVVVSPMLVIEL